MHFNPLLHREAFKRVCNQIRPRPGSTLFAYGNMIRYDPTLVDLTSNVFVLCTNMKVHLYNYSYWVESSRKGLHIFGRNQNRPLIFRDRSIPGGTLIFSSYVGSGPASTLPSSEHITYFVKTL